MASFLDLLMFLALVACVLSGFPVAFAISGVAILFASLGWAFGVMDIQLLGALGQRVFGVLINSSLLAIPLFVLMGVILERSKIADALLDTMGRLFGRMYGGLGISVVLVGALLAASTGIVGATVIAMGMIALPSMLRAGYRPSLASGLVCTAGTLGQIIPPSTLLIILADVMSTSYQQAQYAQGKFSITAISVGDLFAAALFPGIVLVGLYILYLLLRGMFRPQDMPPLQSKGESYPTVMEVVHSVLPSLILIIAVLGAILGGVASPTEAASVGAIGALLLAGIKSSPHRRIILVGALALMILVVFANSYPIRFQRSDITLFQYAVGGGYVILMLMGMLAIMLSVLAFYQQGELGVALLSTMKVNAMVFSTILMASVFSLVFIGLGGEERVSSILTAIPGGPTGALVFSMVFIFVLGFFLDFVEIAVILLPLIVPVLLGMGHDPIWLSILIAINLQTSFLTPPFGFSLFYLRGIAPPSISTGQIYKGVLPFILIQIIGVIIVWLFPSLTTWLPERLF